MGYLWQTDELICYDVINPTQYVFHEDTETCTPVYTKYDEDYEKFYAAALLDVEEAKKTREYGLDIVNHPNWFDGQRVISGQNSTGSTIMKTELCIKQRGRCIYDDSSI